MWSETAPSRCSDTWRTNSIPLVDALCTGNKMPAKTQTKRSDKWCQMWTCHPLSSNRSSSRMVQSIERRWKSKTKYYSPYDGSRKRISYPAKNISKNQLPGTANTRIASSVSVSPMIRNGMQARINRLETKNMALAGAWTWKIETLNIAKHCQGQLNSPIVSWTLSILDSSVRRLVEKWQNSRRPSALPLHCNSV